MSADKKKKIDPKRIVSEAMLFIGIVVLGAGLWFHYSPWVSLIVVGSIVVSLGIALVATEIYISMVVRITRGQ